MTKDTIVLWMTISYISTSCIERWQICNMKAFQHQATSINKQVVFVVLFNSVDSYRWQQHVDHIRMYNLIENKHMKIHITLEREAMRWCSCKKYVNDMNVNWKSVFMNMQQKERYCNIQLHLYLRFQMKQIALFEYHVIIMCWLHDILWP